MPNINDRGLILNEIVLGDCVTQMRNLPSESVHAVITDPPYLVGYVDRSGRSIQGDVEAQWLCPAFAEIYRLMRPDTVCVSFYGWSKVDQFVDAWRRAGLQLVGHLTFPKRYTSTSRFVRYQHENAYLLAKGRPAVPDSPIGDVIDWTYSGNKFHPTQKPVQVLTPLIESFCPRGGVVLDPFAGSGSTLVAARSVGRQFIGIEIDPVYHRIASKRIEAYTRALRVGIDAADHLPLAA